MTTELFLLHKKLYKLRTLLEPSIISVRERRPFYISRRAGKVIQNQKTKNAKRKYGNYLEMLGYRAS